VIDQILVWLDETFPWVSQYSDFLKGAGGIAAILGLVVGAAIKICFSVRAKRRREQQRVKFQVNVEKDWELPTHRELATRAEPFTRWNLIVTNTGELPITVTSISLILPRPTGGQTEMFNSCANPSGKTIQPSASVTFQGPRVDWNYGPWKDLRNSAAPTTGQLPYYRLGITGMRHEFRLTRADLEDIFKVTG